jgi:hypothetical protein
MSNNKNMSSNLWVVDDPFISGRLLGYLQDHVFGADYPIIANDGVIKICDSGNRTELAADVELPGYVVQMLSGFLIEGMSSQEMDMDAINTNVSLSSDISIFKNEAQIVCNTPKEYGCFYALLLRTDEGYSIQGLIQKNGSDRAYNRVDLVNDFSTEITQLIQICDMGDPENPLIVGLDETEKRLIAYSSKGEKVFEKNFETPMLFSTVLSPGIRLVGFDGASIQFIDMLDNGFKLVGRIEIEADKSVCFFDSIKSHATESPLFCFYDGNRLNYIDLFEMKIQNSIEATGLKPGLDSTCFPCEDGLMFVENTIVSPEEIFIQKIKISDSDFEPIFRFQIGSYDGGLYGFRQIKENKTSIKIFYAYPHGKDTIKEYTFDNIEERIESIEFDPKKKKLYMFADGVYFVTEPISKWVETSSTKLQGFE